jgi:dynein heavy chain
VSKVFQGIAKASPKGIRNDGELIKLWAHECMRVFKDRLINPEDRNKFDGLLKEVTKEKFKKEWEKLVEVEPLLFASFVTQIYPDNDETKKPYNDIYCELTNREKMKNQCNQSLDEFNSSNPSKKMNLVLFLDAMEHIVKIHRIITTPYGNALLVGVGGSGRKSVTELATSIACFEIMQIEITKGYGINEWRDDIRKIMFNCGVEFNDTIFMFSDTQIANETFVEDINNLLNNGEIPNLFSAPEDMQNVLDGIKDSTKGQSNVKNFQDAEYFHYFITRCK